MGGGGRVRGANIEKHTKKKKRAEGGGGGADVNVESLPRLLTLAHNQQQKTADTMTRAVRGSGCIA